MFANSKVCRTPCAAMAFIALAASSGFAQQPEKTSKPTTFGAPTILNIGAIDKNSGGSRAPKTISGVDVVSTGRASIGIGRQGSGAVTPFGTASINAGINGTGTGRLGSGPGRIGGAAKNTSTINGSIVQPRVR